MSSTVKLKTHAIPLLLLLLLFLSSAVAGGENRTPPECLNSGGSCRDKAEALKFKLIAIGSILATSMLGICLPLFSRSVPALRPGRKPFVVVKAFAAGVILATGYMHVLPDSFQCLNSPCLPTTPWQKFPFAAFVTMLSAVVTLMVDSFSMSCYRKRFPQVLDVAANEEVEEEKSVAKDYSLELIRHRVVAQVLELGIVVHSVVIGLSLGASDNRCTIRPLIAALCFHQLFEGMGLGGCILQAEYGMKMKAIMAFFFSFTTPFGIALGIGLSNVYSDNSPTELIVVGLLNACSAGLLQYMALVELLASDFLGSTLQASVNLQLWSYSAVLLGAGGMSLMAKWA